MFRITFLGHAGFCVETEGAVIVMDPWLSQHGAFDASWFQYPRNHHLAAFVREKLADPSRARYVYLSHEHQDHFDPAFLESLAGRDFRIVVPKFQRRTWLDRVRSYRCDAVLALAHGLEFAIPGGSITLYVDDSGLNRDSAIVVRTPEGAFLNLNDCRIFDVIPRILERGPIDVFSCQFSGASWHPTCYEYDANRYAAISERKCTAKFETVARAIEAVKPRVFLPAAGPACFLDPLLVHLNFERVNIFAPPSHLRRYLANRPAIEAHVPELFPGDEIDLVTGTIVEKAVERPTNEAARAAHLQKYIASYAPFFAARAAQNAHVDASAVFSRLSRELARKADALVFAERVIVPLYVELDEFPDRLLRVNFAARRVDVVSTIGEAPHYRIAFPAWSVAKVLDGTLSWDEFALSLRARLSRAPDVYQPLIHAFLVMQAEDFAIFGDMLRQIEARDERIEIETPQGRFSIDRYCPHNGADLREAWIDGTATVVCPRHRWQFDLADGGRCTTNETSIRACAVDGPRVTVAAGR